MKRLVVMTVGKTHSGKTTFARELEKNLENAIVVDQDNQAEFINEHYKHLQPKQGPNTLKHAISKAIVDYAVKQTEYNLILCNSNRSRAGREYLFNHFFVKDEFVRILVHFDLPDDVLEQRISNSKRSNAIFRNALEFREVLNRQQMDGSAVAPTSEEADHLFVIKSDSETDVVIKKIQNLARNLEGGAGL